MTLKTVVCIAAAATGVGLMGTSLAHAAPPGFCERYAESAVRQNERNHRWDCGYAGLRWHGWEKAHYKWCRNVSKGVAREGRRHRRWMLERCRW